MLACSLKALAIFIGLYSCCLICSSILAKAAQTVKDVVRLAALGLRGKMRHLLYWKAVVLPK